MILVDSGSSHTFVSTAVVAQMKGMPSLQKSFLVKVANGNDMVCQHQLLQIPWEV
jgi:hypothetical protein